MNTQVEGIVVTLKTEMELLAGHLRLLYLCLKQNQIALPSVEEIEEEIAGFMGHASIHLVRSYLHEQLYLDFNGRLEKVLSMEETLVAGIKTYLTTFKMYMDNLENQIVPPIKLTASECWKETFINAKLTHDIIDKFKKDDGCDSSGRVVNLKLWEKNRKSQYKEAVEDLYICFDTIIEVMSHAFSKVLSKPIEILSNLPEEGYRCFDVWVMGNAFDGDFIIKSAGDIRVLEWENGITDSKVSVHKKLSNILKYDGKRLSKKTRKLLEDAIKSLE